jgi:hypothetical protein
MTSPRFEVAVLAVKKRLVRRGTRYGRPRPAACTDGLLLVSCFSMAAVHGPTSAPIDIMS